MSESLSYRDAGVDIAAADALVERLADLARSTHTPGVVSHSSRFAGLFRLNLEGMGDPLVAVTCDGVGTKLLVARAAGSLRGLGQDLVAMSVNDLLPIGARPLVFLDYLAAGKLEPAVLEEIVAGVANACRKVGCALIGGETAEMPGVYAAGDFDLAGFAVGLVDGERLPDPTRVTAGDVVLGLPSAGVHASGFSLVRKALLERGGLRLDAQMTELGRTLGEELCEPTALYVEPVLRLHESFAVKAAAHITGGGLAGRGAALLGARQRMVLEAQSFVVPPIFALIAEHGRVKPADMLSTFNMGLGFLAILDPAQADAALAQPQTPWRRVGRIEPGEKGVELV
jgi:phosphoribosylformylglycinamidine cyclo-ligase